MFTKAEINLALSTYEAIKKIAKREGKEWEWNPEIGEWCLIKKKWGTTLKNVVGIIVLVNEDKNIVRVEAVVETDSIFFSGWYRQKDLIPILHWEKLEEILEGLGYMVDIRLEQGNFICEVDGYEYWADGKGKTRQEAMMRAVIKLSKETK